MNQSFGRTTRKLLMGAMAVVLTAAVAAAQMSEKEARDLVRGAVQNEIKTTGDGHHFMYRDSTQWKDHSVVNEVIQTDQGNLTRPLAKNGRPLSPEEQADADRKLAKFANDPDARRKARESSKQDDQHASDIMRSLPDAFQYKFIGTDKGPNGHELVKLNFTANPNWSAPARETQVLEGMEGNMVIDKTAMRIAEINGDLFKDVDFGWGILGKLDRGGKFIIHQADVGDGHWEMTLETLRFEGKILMIKPLHIWSTEKMTDFRPVPRNVNTAQALQLLEKSNEVVAQNGGGAEKK